MDTRDRNRTTARRYAGGNERLDALLINFPDDTVWIVEGVNGRTVLTGDTEAQVIEAYNAVPNRWKKSEKDS